MPEPLEPIVLATALPAIGRGVIASPFQFLVTGEDNLRLSTLNSQTGVTVAIHGRMLTREGKLVGFAHTHTPNTDRTLREQDYPLGEGFLVNCTVFASAGAPSLGQTFVILRIIRGLTGATIVLGTLLQGYVTAVQGVAWPGSPILSSVEGAPFHRIFTGTNPAAGARFSETVPTGVRWRPVTVSAFLTTSAAPGSRRPMLDFNRAGSLVMRSPHATTLGASSSRTFLWAAGLPHETVVSPSGPAVAGLPWPAFLLAGDIIQENGDGFDAGDDWNAPIVVVEEWLEPG